MEGLTAAQIDSYVESNELDHLLKHDQLKNIMATGEAFAELNEGKITFPPTYKYEFGTQDYDLKYDLKYDFTIKKKKKGKKGSFSLFTRRRPSWTDRILYKVNEDVYENITLKAVQSNYQRHSSYVQSDHKPVTSEFNIVVTKRIIILIYFFIFIFFCFLYASS